MTVPVRLTGVPVGEGTAPVTAEVVDRAVRLAPAAAPAPGTPPRSLLLPGLVNLHDHLRAFMPTGRRTEGAPLTQVITAAAATQAVATPQEHRALTALASARQLRAGVTSVVDHVYPLHRPELLDAAVAGHRDVGVRASVALGVMTRGDARTCTTVADVARLAERALAELLPADRLFLAPVSLRQAAAEDYADTVAAADRLGLRLYTHIAETVAEVEQCVAEHGVRPVELLHRLGFLRPGTVLVHCVQLSDREVGLLAGTGTAVVYCPTNHLRLAKGFARVADLVDAGVTVGLGIDGTESLFHEMRQAVYAQGQARLDPAALGSAAAYAMATVQGARALGVAGVDGRLDGSPDVVRLDARRVGLQPLVDPVWSVVHRAGPGDVTDVVVDGRLVLHDGRLTGSDEDELVERAYVATRDMAHRTGTTDPADWPPVDLSDRLDRRSNTREGTQ
ncbi:amidohydrolase family protein [Actinotalea sp. JY-7876]|uniref:amidohydrolase family protein n=1 Tax=Actinotalea sp. JY-7876 TaxID=2758442 RepID=UPI0015F4292F|nr:amidohydrolase family protein [Actinotalea sp. JY-7876]